MENKVLINNIGDLKDFSCKLPRHLMEQVIVPFKYPVIIKYTNDKLEYIYNFTISPINIEPTRF